MARDRTSHAKHQEVGAETAPTASALADSTAANPPTNCRSTASRSLPRRGASDLDRLRAAREVVAALVLRDPVYAPIFKRLDDEIAEEEAALSQDVVARARAVLRHRATGASNS